jgi:hypothetical protein
MAASDHLSKHQFRMKKLAAGALLVGSLGGALAHAPEPFSGAEGRDTTIAAMEQRRDQRQKDQRQQISGGQSKIKTCPGCPW